MKMLLKGSRVISAGVATKFFEETPEELPKEMFTESLKKKSLNKP